MADRYEFLRMLLVVIPLAFVWFPAVAAFISVLAIAVFVSALLGICIVLAAAGWLDAMGELNHVLTTARDN